MPKKQRRKVRIDKVSPHRLTSDQLVEAIRAKLDGKPPYYIVLDRRIPANRGAK
jgi:hypothetical protein